MRFASCQAPNAEGDFAAIASYLAKRLGMSAEIESSLDWAAREAALFAGEIDVGWICGLPYGLEADRAQPGIKLLAAAVMASERYAGRPAYFSDVVVRADSGLRDFEELRGTRWAFNELHSHSGYNITRFMLAQKGLDGSFFSEVVQAGSHEGALIRLLRGRIDASALDSTVLETELRKAPDLAREVRVIESWGPSPIPPWVLRRDLPTPTSAALLHEITHMHESQAGRAILDAAAVDRFVAVADDAYDPIRAMYRQARTIQLKETGKD